jgi:hypothetical protein
MSFICKLGNSSYSNNEVTCRRRRPDRSQPTRTTGDLYITEATRRLFFFADIKNPNPTTKAHAWTSTDRDLSHRSPASGDANGRTRAPNPSLYLNLAHHGRQDERVRRRQPRVSHLSSLPFRALQLVFVESRDSPLISVYLGILSSKIFIGGLSKDTDMSKCSSDPVLLYGVFL